MLALRVLGGFEVLREGKEAPELTAQRGRSALLVYLAMEGSASRDAAVGVLWPEHDPLKARHALSQTLHRLRGSLGEDWLETEGERLAVAASVQVDAREFATLVEAGEHEEALALYRGPFLSGWFLSDAPGFERWADQQRARLDRLHRLARREAIRIRRERGDLAAALRLAQDWAEVDPLEDEAQHRLIELLAESGRRADALQQFDLHSRLLEQEELTPLDDTVQLVSRLRQGADVGPLDDVSAALDPGPAKTEPEPGARPPPDRATGGAELPATHPAEGSIAGTPGHALGAAKVSRAKAAGWALLALTAITAAVLVGLRVMPGLGADQGGLPPGARVVLADFGNDTRDSLVSGVVTEALRIDLERHLHSALVDPAEIARVLGRMQRSPISPLTGETAREVAVRAGVSAVVDGTVGAVGPGFVLSAWVVAAEDGHVLDAAMATAADSTRLIEAIEALSKRLRQIVNPAVSELSRPEHLEQVTTSSLEALRKYSAAARIWRLQGDATRTIRLLEEATALDSTFAMAYRMRAVVLRGGGGDRQAWIDALTAAYRHRDHLSEPERYLTIATYQQNGTGNLEEAIDAYEDLLALDSTQVVALNNLSVIYRDLRDFDHAEVLLRRCMAADPRGQTCAINLADVVHALGRSAEARAIADSLVVRYPENPFVASQPGWIAAAGHDYALADSLFADMARLELPNPGGLENWLGYVDLVRGRAREARRHYEEAYRVARSSQPVTALAALAAIAWMEVEVLKDTAGAVASMDGALRDPVFAAMDPVAIPYLDIADFYLAAGRPDRAEAMVETFLTEVPPELRQEMDRWLYMIRGRIAMARGRLEEARQAFQIADTYPGSPFLTLQYLGPLDEMAGRPDSAIVSYERYLSVGTTDRLVWDSLLLPGVLERLGQLHEGAGHAREAAGYYTRFADLWAGADPELRPRAERARQRAEALARGGGAT